jgi:hypothetical protein
LSGPAEALPRGQGKPIGFLIPSGPTVRAEGHSHSIVDRQENPFDINIIFEAEQQDAMKNAMPSSPGAG